MLVTTMLFAALAADPIKATPTTCRPGAHQVMLHRVPVRCGPSINDAVFAQVPQGSMINVIDSKPGWARVSLTGPTFQNAAGIIRYPADEPGRFELETERRGVTNGTMEVYVPNGTRGGWSDVCWVCTVAAGTPIEVLRTQTIDAGTTGTEAYTVHTVALPSSAAGWVVASALQPADSVPTTPIAASATPAWMMMQPTSPIADWNAWRVARPAWLASQETREAEVEPVEEVEVAEVIVPPAPPVYVNPRWEALERAVTAAPISSFDTEAIRSFRTGYIAIIDEETETHPELAEMAEVRLKQLELASSLNDTRASIDAARARMKRSTEDLSAQARRLDESPEYVLRGTLAVSPVFDGVDRPLFYRLKDPFSNRSLAYISTEDPKVDLRGMLGQRIGVVGPTHWDSTWSVVMVDPQRVDLVSVTPPR